MFMFAGRAASAVAFLLLILPAHATAGAPRRTYIPVDIPTRAAGPQPAAAGPALIYLNRCSTGCTVSPGVDDSRADTSSIISNTIFVSPFDKGDDAWSDVVNCVRRIYAPFNVDVTDVDPGTIPHHEAIVAGTPTESGFPENYGGVAPYACGQIPNSVTYSFANVWWSANEICETVAQETAHAFGLDHAVLCNDPMTYLAPCGPKSFQNFDAPCGEKEERECFCGGTTQNSFRMIETMFGPGDPPLAEFSRPRSGDLVGPGFVIEVGVGTAPISRIEVYAAGKRIAEGTIPPFIFNAPSDLPPGPLELEVRSTDPQNRSGSARITVNYQACASDSDCGGGYDCIAGRCVLSPGSAGGLGEACDSDTECSADLCGRTSDGDGICTATCDLSRDDCPGGFTCTESGSGPVCWPSGGGCSAGGDRLPPIGLVLLALGCLTVWRRPGS